MARYLTWLHLSDLHVGQPQSDLPVKRISRALIDDLENMRDRHGLKPDFVFFTGDLAFGQRSNTVGKEETLVEQYQTGEKFLSDVRRTFSITIDNCFIVPGNHDVNRKTITDYETEWL